MPDAIPITILLADGTASGIKVISKASWTGQSVVAPRSDLSRALKERTELDRYGVYVLKGEDESGSPEMYIGQSYSVTTRLKNHIVKDDWDWDTVIAFISADSSLNRTHTEYIEARLISLGLEAKQWTVRNGTNPPIPNLSEIDRAAANAFLRDILLICPMVGVDAFVPASEEEPVERNVSDLVLKYTPKGSSTTVQARGMSTTTGFKVLKGSKAVKVEREGCRPGIIDLRKELLAKGVLADRGSFLVFTQDYRFDSPSGAGVVVKGTEVNGRTDWKDKKGRSLKEIEEAGL